MYWTTTADIIAHVDAPNVAEYRAEILDDIMPGWESDEMRGEAGGRYVDAGDVSLYDASADVDMPTDAEWATFAEMLFSDPAERDLG